MKKSELLFKGSLGFAIIALTLLAAAVTGLYFGVALGRNALQEGDISDESELLFDLSELVSEVPEKLTSASDGSAAFAESFASAAESEPETSASRAEGTEIEHGWVINSHGYTYLYNGRGYRQFNYGSAALGRYVDTLAAFCREVSGSSRVFNLPAPVSTTFADIPREIYKEDNFYNLPQSTFVAAVSTELGADAATIDIVDRLESLYDAGESVYYNTDSNWTPLAAYHAYEAFCNAAGIKSLSVSEFGNCGYGGFLGDFYKATGSALLAENEDDFYCLTPPKGITTELNAYVSGKKRSGYSLCANRYSKDDPFGVYFGIKASRYEIISNAEGGGSLLVIGDTSCRPMIPLLTAHYSRIDYIDPATFQENLIEFAAKRNYDDILISMYTVNAVSGAEVPAFANLIGSKDNGQ